MSFWKRLAKNRTPDDQASLSHGGHGPTKTSVAVESISSSRFGMFILSDKPSNKAKIIDIIAIHGLNGDYERTWTTTSASGKPVNWLRDLLPQHIPSARIMSYGYNSAVQFSKSVGGIGTFAEQLLQDIMAWRNTIEERARPVIFVCHSLGGIVFKQALIRARERDQFSQLLSHIRGVAFFGTPHCGSDLARWGSVFANILRSASFGISTNTRLVKDLQSNSDVLRHISKSFVERGKGLEIVSFYETDRLDFLNCTVVQEDSATLGWPNETTIAINGDHRSICQFSSLDEKRYRNVWITLQQMANMAVSRALSDEEKASLLRLYTSDYESHRRRNPKPVDGTCLWFLRHSKYLDWQQGQLPSMLWVSADPGCGKSVLASFLIDNQGIERETAANVCYFFFKDDNEEQRNSISAISALLHQIYRKQPELLHHFITSQSMKGPTAVKQFQTLWEIFIQTVQDPESNGTICIIDALDECEKTSRKEFTNALVEYFREERKHQPGSPILKVLITSRPDNAIKTSFSKLSNIRLRGENETEAISQDVERVVQASINELESSGLPRELLGGLQEQLIERADRTFLWTTLAITLLKDASESGASKQDLEAILHSRDIDAIYTRLLNAQMKASRAAILRMLTIVVASSRPLTLEEMSIAMGISNDHSRLADVVPTMKHPFENHVKSLCGHFLRIIHDKIYLVHQTARDFLLNQDVDKHGQKDDLIDSKDVMSLDDSKISYEKVMRLNNKNFDSEISAARLTRLDYTTFTWQKSIRLQEAQYLMLNICSKYICLMAQDFKAILKRKTFHNSQEAFEMARNVRDIGFIEYAALYWPLHRRQVGNSTLTIEEIRDLDDICNPDFPGFYIWVQRHESYMINFPGKMFVKGTHSSSHEEVLAFFEVDIAHLDFKINEHDTSSDEEDGSIYSEGLLAQWKEEDTDREDFHKDLEVLSPDAKMSSPLPDRFSYYRQAKRQTNLEKILLVGSQAMSCMPLGHSFPQAKSTTGTLLVDYEKKRMSRD